jgi:hypothetical protein
MVVSWLGYTTVLYGYCLVKGYDITFGQLANPAHVFTWPKTPQLIPANQVSPGGGTAGASNVAGGGAATTGDTLTAATSSGGGGTSSGGGSASAGSIAAQVANSFPIISPPGPNISGARK